MDLRIGIGTSQSLQSTVAGQEAIRQALQAADADHADFLLIFADSEFDQTSLIQSINQTAPTAMIGGSTAGEINSQSIQQQSVVVVSFTSREITFSPVLVENFGQNQLKAGEQAAQNALNQCPNPNQRKSFLTFTDGLIGNQLAAIQGIQNILGEDFDIVGAATANRSTFQNTYQYFNGRVYQNALVGVLIAGDISTGSAVASGWIGIGNQLICTKTNPDTIIQLDHQPALDIYQLYLGPERKDKLPAIAFEYPFGIIPPANNSLSNFHNHDFISTQFITPFMYNSESSIIKSNTTISPDTPLTIAAATRQNLLNNLQEVVLKAQNNLAGAQPLLILNFSSLGHKFVMGKRATEQITIIKKTIGNQVPLAGFFGYGEIGPPYKSHPDSHTALFHNQSTAVWILGTNLFANKPTHQPISKQY